MSWKKLNEYVDMWGKPVLGTENQENGERFMGLTIDPTSKNPYRGIARQIIYREGSPDVPGYLDISKLIVVESYDLLSWKILGDLKINGIQEIINDLISKNEKFIGLEDPDILVDENGKKHVYFTIAFRYNKKIIDSNNNLSDVVLNEIYLGHAEGKNFDDLIATKPILKRFNSEIVGFKEVCPLFFNSNENKLILTETFVDRNKMGYSAISIIEAKDFSNKWNYKKLVHDPLKETKHWCMEHSSPCRIFNPKFLSHKKYLVGIMNGRENSRIVMDKKVYGKFRPGLFLFDIKRMEIVWIDDNPLFEDPVATTITFASDMVYLNKNEVILYAHPNDSFVRAYKLKLSKIKELLPKDI